MALPKLEVPTYELELPISKKKIKYRPFLVKEQKNLLMAMESGDAASIQHNVREILDVCTLTTGIDVEELPILDIEYYFINLRAKSVGETIESKYRCNNDVTDAEGTHKCGNLVPIEFNLLEVELPKMPKDNGKIMITDKLGIMMKYPTFEILQKYQENDDAVILLNMIVSCIDYIFDEEQIYYAKDTTENELTEFIEGLQAADLQKIKEFLESMPKIKKDVQFKCGKCGYEENIELVGAQSFFV